MNVFTIKLLTSYVLMPLLAILFGFLAFMLAKKNRLLSNKKFIFYILLSAILLCLPGFLGFIDYWFMPYVYIALQVVYLILGWYNIKVLRHFLPDLDKIDTEGKRVTPYYVEFLISFLIMFIAAAFFSMIFNFVNELQYGLWACTCLLSFMFPSLYRETYRVYLQIPLEIYKVWIYKSNEDLSSFEAMDYNKLLVLELEFFKNVNDSVPTKVKAKSPDNMPFGVWFQKFLSDYNLKFPTTPVAVRSSEGTYGWIFYVKRSFFHPRRYVDYELSVTENKLKEQYTIIAKRVTEQVDEVEVAVPDNNNIEPIN